MGAARRTRRRGSGRLAVLAAVLFAAHGARPSSPRAQAPLDAHDVLGAPVELVGARTRATIVFFTSRRAERESTALFREVDQRTVHLPIDTVTVVDVRRYGGALLRPIAERRMRTAAVTSRERRRERRARLPAGTSASPADRWFLVGDFDGRILARFGVEAEPAHPVAFVVARDGRITGPFGDTEAVVRAVERAQRGR